MKSRLYTVICIKIYIHWFVKQAIF